MLSKKLIIRGDDLGVTHSVNMGFKKLAEKGVMKAWSIMAPCSWFPEAVEIAKEFHEVDLGMHLTLMSEWGSYKWGPVAGASKVPCLINNDGYFYSNPVELLASDPKPEEVEIELRAQIEKVIRTGLKLRYIDNSHGNICHMSPMVNKIANKLAVEYDLQVSPYVFDPNLDIVTSASPTPEDKLEAVLNWLKKPSVSPSYQFLCLHPMEDTPEQKALRLPPEIDIPFLQEMVYHNIADTEAVAKQEFKDGLQALGINLVRYRDLPESEQLRQLEIWPPQVISQMFTIMGASPEIINQVVSMN